MSGLRPVQLVVIALLCVVYPAASHAFPSIGRAWGMYASTSMYRIELVGVDHAGARVAIPLENVARDASPRAATALVGAEHWRHGSVLSLPNRLALVAAHACRSDLRDVEITIEWREREGAELQARRAVVSCSR